MRRAAVLTALGVALALAWTPPAGAVVRAATADDDVGDGPTEARDIRTVSATYDSAGSLTIATTLLATPEAGTASTLFAYAGIEDAGGFCRRPFLVLSASTAGSAAEWSDDGGAAQPATRVTDGARITLSMSSANVANRNYDCASAALFDPAAPAETPVQFDAITPFHLVGPPSPPPPPPPPPPVTPPPPPPAGNDPAPRNPGSDKTLKGRAGPHVIYGICGRDLCRVDPKTRRLTRLARGKPGAEYDAVSASPSGGTVAFAYDENVFRARRDAKRRAKLAPGIDPLVSADGRSVAWWRNVLVPKCIPSATGGVDCPFLPSPVLFTRASGEQQDHRVKNDFRGGGWLGSALMEQVDPEGASTAEQICLLKGRSAGTDEGRCERTLVQDPARALTNPAASPDARTIAVVSEPAPAAGASLLDRGRIELYNAATGRRLRVLTTGRHDATPMFSPDGKQVAFNRGRDVLVVATRGGTAKLVKRNVTLTGPSWAKRT